MAIYRRVVIEDVTVDHVPTEDETEAAGGFLDWLEANGEVARQGVMVEFCEWIDLRPASDATEVDWVDQLDGGIVTGDEDE